jgi:hypothetical protein
VKKPLQTQDFLFSKNIMEREYPIVRIGALLTEEGLPDHSPNIKICSIKKNLKSLSLLPAFIPVSVVINESQPKIGLSQKDICSSC